MAKVIAVSDDAYEKLKRIKGSDSFSKAIIRLMEPKKRRTLLEIVESWGPDEEFARKIEEAHAQVRKMKFRRVEL